MSGALFLVSIGPGDLNHLTLAAQHHLRAAEVVIGYQLYVDLIRPLLAEHQDVVLSPMGEEVERARTAIEMARQGRRVALISSGDVGVYAMAAPVFELLRSQNWQGHDPPVVVTPGVSAFQAVAARVGAAIGHDFCAISLSDLLTPWPIIERRIAAAAWGDFVIAFYNPRSKERSWQLGRAMEILRRFRPPSTPVAVARNITRRNERVQVTTLEALDVETVDMFSLVLVGNSQSFMVAGHFATPRGYAAGHLDKFAPEGIVESPNAANMTTAGVRLLYPITLTQLAGAAVVVCGGGKVGERKVRGLLDAATAEGAAPRIRLISPTATETLQRWAAEGRIDWEARPYAPGDLVGARLVFAATSERAVNAAIAQEAAAVGALCNVADAPEEGDFHVPAVLRTEDALIAVSTGGADPRRAAACRDQIGRLLAQARNHREDTE
ncbi:precorrin-3B C(17)-methyltransferase [Caldilinea sp.]|uniref:precorrin-3B C(17)-methyltransferase n=1 Tax=Caldilinea sp. TaxID=2293560 RepID=UPI00261CE552|nr:precorrin-3B C(17)-methyltransferase [uncultured Caldilinea sp.]